MSNLDIDYVRAQFPAVKEHMFFDNAGGTLVPESVITLVREHDAQSGTTRCELPCIQ